MIKFTVSDEAEQKLDQLANKLGITKHQLAKLIVTENIENFEKTAQDNLLDFPNLKTHIYINKLIKLRVEEFAELHHWSFSKEVNFILLNAVSSKPQFLDEEVNTLRILRADLNKLGRNFVYLIKNKMIINSENKEFKEKVQEILDNTKELNTTVEKLKKKASIRYKGQSQQE